MTKGNPEWEKFERDVQDLLDLRCTPGSGNQWHDVGDARSKPDDKYRLIVDCKYTVGKSYSLNGAALRIWVNHANEMGYHFALPVRVAGASGKDQDWVTLPLDDYAELVDAARTLWGSNRCGSFHAHTLGLPCCRKLGHFGSHDNGTIEWSA